MIAFSLALQDSDIQMNHIMFPRSYSDIELHRTMIEDSVRTNAYQQAIFQNMEEHIRDKVVVDVGCGTGILSMFCAQAGAKKVYAIDASKIAIHAKQLIEANGFSNIITGKNIFVFIKFPRKVWFFLNFSKYTI